jgi:phosphoribosylaminoimidazole carboxylase (NCAIR synthetase)
MVVCSLIYLCADLCFLRQNRGKMLANGIMPRVSDPSGQINSDAYSTSQFFNKVCAPRCVYAISWPRSSASQLVDAIF